MLGLRRLREHLSSKCSFHDFGHDKKQIARGDAIMNLAKYGKQFGIKF